MMDEPTLVNIEIGHVDWNDLDVRDSLSESLMLAKEYVAERQLSRHQYVITMLIDDKRDLVRRRAEWLEDVERQYRQFFMEVDFLVFESCLVSLREKFLAILGDRDRKRIEREMARYENRHGVIACSHDIAIWHAYRLGWLGKDEACLRRGKEGNGSWERFFAQSVVSILEEEDIPPERRARELLSMLNKSDALSKIQLIHYAI